MIKILEIFSALNQNSILNHKGIASLHMYIFRQIDCAIYFLWQSSSGIASIMIDYRFLILKNDTHCILQDLFKFETR